MKLLELNNLSIAFKDREKASNKIVVDDISFIVQESEMLALVGESGSGKSVTALSILGLLPDYATISGEITFNNTILQQGKNSNFSDIRGNEISMIFQEPMTSLNPLHTIGKQLSEVLILHGVNNKESINLKIVKALKEVGLDNLTERLNAYPNELSGGQRQRVMIAMALINNPKLLIADEPTTALDVTVQKQILELLRKLQKEKKMSILLITHDLSVVEKYSDRTIVMQNGKIVENATTDEIINKPKHSYTKHLISSIPKGIREKYSGSKNIILKTQNLNGRPLKYLHAVKDINIEINEGETLAVVGESGSGKSTLAYSILRLINSDGLITVMDKNINVMEKEELRRTRKNMQIVFQDPYSSLNPRLSVGAIISEGLIAHYPDLSLNERDNKVINALKEVGLEADMRHRYPHEFSGGQRQRIGIARCMVLEPKIVLLDEPSSALDVSTQSEILKLLIKLQVDKKISYLFISHDLRVVRTIAHRIIVMKNGEIIEHGYSSQIFSSPNNNYTKELLGAALIS
jgi:microcin C transport system ATP-binding protein